MVTKKTFKFSVYITWKAKIHCGLLHREGACSRLSCLNSLSNTYDISVTGKVLKYNLEAKHKVTCVSKLYHGIVRNDACGQLKMWRSFLRDELGSALYIKYEAWDHITRLYFQSALLLTCIWHQLRFLKNKIENKYTLLWLEFKIACNC